MSAGQGWGLKTPVVALQRGDAWHVRAARELTAEEIWEPSPRVHAFWFAWYAMHGSPVD
jgi:hypothetical protein